MKRISTSTKSIDLFGSGKHGFNNGNLANGIQPTNLESEWFNQVQEEISRAIEGAGLVLDGNVKTQLLQAIRRMAGGNVRTITAGHTVLTADDAGLVLVDGTAGAVTISLPSASILRALQISFRRIDSTSNSVTISVAGIGADVIDAGDSSFVLIGNDTRKVVSDGVSSWHSDIGVMTQSQGDTRYIRVSSVDETGKRVSFFRSSAPVGYIKANGLTIGSEASGATNRANADTQALFTLFWHEFDNVLLHIQDSSGSPTVRGVSSAEDWSANKRMPVFDCRGTFSRGWDDERGINPDQALGEYKEDTFKSHAHGGVIRYDDRINGYAIDVQTDNDAIMISNHSTDSTGGTETAPKSIAELVCIKL